MYSAMPNGDALDCTKPPTVSVASPRGRGPLISSIDVKPRPIGHSSKRIILAPRERALAARLEVDLC